MVETADVFRALTVACFAGLCLVVVGVGGVAVVAESMNTWVWYFRMEQVIAVGTPVVLGLLGLTLVSAIGFVVAFPTNTG
jgi:hypothetical protein